jgi:hypothetical protein
LGAAPRAEPSITFDNADIMKINIIADTPPPYPDTSTPEASFLSLLIIMVVLTSVPLTATLIIQAPQPPLDQDLPLQLLPTQAQVRARKPKDSG